VQNNIDIQLIFEQETTPSNELCGHCKNHSVFI